MHKLRQQLAVKSEVCGQQCQIESTISFSFFSLELRLLFFFHIRNVAFKLCKVEDVFFFSLSSLSFFFLYIDVFFLPSVDLFICVLHPVVGFPDFVWILHEEVQESRHRPADLKTVRNRPCISKDYVYPFSNCSQ